MKYKISSQFFPFNLFKPPINEKFLKIASKTMKPPVRFLKSTKCNVVCESTLSFDNEEVKYYVVTPKTIKNKAPCLFYAHGGGFVLEAARYHYLNVLEYAEKVGCIVVFPIYRLAPKYPFPYAHEDCYHIFERIYKDADKLNIDINKIGIGGDSAGSSLAVGLCFMIKDRKHPANLSFQMLLYPFLDSRNNSESCKKFVDTPMWNSSLSNKIGSMVKVDKNDYRYEYYSCLEREDLSFLPRAYIEVAEFDCLHDDGMNYAKRLRDLNISIELNEIAGTMHGFDIVRKSSIAKKAREARIEFMKKCLK